MKMHKEYIELYKEYSQKYGRNTAIFLQVGSFYEVYDIQDRETGESQCNVREIVDILGIQLSSKKGDFSEKEDGLFAGFPDYVMHKWAGRLTAIGWTVIVVDQIKDMRGKVKERKVSRILSPSTHIENTSSTDTPYLCVLYFQSTDQAPLFGAGLLDLTTGTTRTYSGQASGRSDMWTADEVVQLLSVYSPKEIVIRWKGSIPEENVLRRMLSIPASIVIHLCTIDATESFASDLVRTEYLQRIYCIKSILPARTYLGIRTNQEEFALMYLLQFVEEHYPSMIKSFQRNEPWIPHTRLICGNHALTQLQMTNHANPMESVIGLFDKGITPMGKRAIKERLLSPYSDANEIRARLTEVQDYMVWPAEKSKQLVQQLRFMFDLPRLHRKVLCGLIIPAEFAGLFQTYAAMQHIIQHVIPDTVFVAPFTADEWLTYKTMVDAHISEDKAQCANGDLSVLNVETYPDIGKKEAEIQLILEKFQHLRREIAKRANVNDDAIRLEEREKEPYGLKASTITLQQVRKNSKEVDGMKITELKSGGWIDCTALQQYNTALQKARESLEHLIRTHLPDACAAISDAGQIIWAQMEQWISHVDTTQCIGRTSKERGFHCPVIESAEEGSAVDIQQIRHPLVEASATRVSYVKHTIRLGFNNRGYLVYGVNASGKSTMMKATGLCVLLAQAGCFVPAQSMVLRPFQAIYTRILNQDNLFAGLSSFAVEMSELRDILRHANKHTLVLGDELCNGTESVSAQALVTSGIQWLSSKNAKFIFATHLHELTRYVDVKKEGVEVWHLHVEYDPITKKLIYDRSLRPGSGSTMYGLEVARAMDLPFEFIEQALKNRHMITGTVAQEHAIGSSWNSHIVRKECEICCSQITKELEVHHIQHRATATNGLLEDGTHMNDKRNLMVICQVCHDKIHGGSIEVGPMKQTSDGPERTIVQVSLKEEKKKKGKWSDEEMQTITDTLKKYTSLSLKAIKGLLNAKYEIEISESMLSRYKSTF